MMKTADYIVFIALNGKEQKRTIYVDESGARYIYNQKHFWKIEDFIKNRCIKNGR